MDQLVSVESSTHIPVIHCIIRDVERGILFFRELLSFDNRGNAIVCTDRSSQADSSHWELPKGTLLSGESLQQAAERIAYDRASLSATFVQPLRREPLQHIGITFHDHHYYVVMDGVEGVFDIDRFNHDNEAQGTWCWIEAAFLGSYAIRRETLSIIYALMR